MTPYKRPHTTRDLLLALGIGNFNATMVIPVMGTQPATTDPKSPGVILLVRYIQRALYAMGGKLNDTGYLDEPTAELLGKLLGPGWINMSWSQVVTAVVTARENKITFAPTTDAGLGGLGWQGILRSAPRRAIGTFDFLPSVPGGAVTYLIGGGLLYHYWNKRKR